MSTVLHSDQPVHLQSISLIVSSLRFLINSRAVLIHLILYRLIYLFQSSALTTMYFKAAVLFSLLASSLAIPTSNGNRKFKRGVLSVQDYSDFQVSSGVAGNALAEVNAKFPVCTYLTSSSSTRNPLLTPP